jgi:hypothetical protein
MKKNTLMHSHPRLAEDPGSTAPRQAFPIAVQTRIHGLIVLSIVIVSGLAYLPLARANYCGFDDTLELQRLTFHDPGSIGNDFHTVLADAINKYRPFLTTLNRITLHLGHSAAALFRARNIVAHLLTSMVLYGIGFLLFDSIPVAAAAALLFSLHPLTNQAVAGGMWVITPANLCLFLSFFLFQLSLRPGRWRLASLAASLTIGPLGVLIYDPVIFLYGLIPLYLCLWVILERKLPPVRHLVVLAAMLVGFLVAWFSLRAAILPPIRSQVTPINTILKNVLIYSVGLTQVFDPILSTDLLRTPLPKEALSGDFDLGWLAIIMLPTAIVLAALVWTIPRWRANLGRRDVIIFGFLLVAWAGSLVPYLFFSTHASETYNYVGIAFLALLAARMLSAMATPPHGQSGPAMTAFAGAVGVLALLYGAATFDRNLRVKSCGDIVGNILRQLPVGELHQGKWDVVFSNLPDEPTSRFYGMYGYKGVDTLGMGDYGSPGIAGAVQFASKNADISASAVAPEQFARLCGAPTPGRLCFWVHADGNLVLGPK